MKLSLNDVQALVRAFRGIPKRALNSRVVDAYGVLAGPRMAKAIRILRTGSARSYHGAYASARYTRLETDWVTSLQSAYDEIRRDAHRLRARARATARDNALGKQYRRLVDLNVVGPDGPKHQALIRDNDDKLNKRLNDRTEDHFGQWSEKVTLDGIHSLSSLGSQVVPQSRVEGEQLIRYWTGPEIDNDWGIALEPIDPDQLDHTYNEEATNGRNAVRMGIEVDSRNRPVAYHVFDSPYSSIRQRKRDRIDAREILHLFDPERVNQGRGVTDFHACLLSLHFAASYAEYELIAARSGAAKPIIWKRIASDVIGTSNIDPKDAGAEQRRPIEELEPGMFGFAPEGYEPANVMVDHPSTAFVAFMIDQKQDASTSLGVSFAALTGNLSQTSFSSARTGTQLERDTWRRMQAWAIRGF